MDQPGDAGRTFQKLKPACVDLSREAIQHLKCPAQSQLDLTKSLHRLHDHLVQLTPLEPRLADYVFFPLSFVFKDLDSLSPAAITLSVQCLQSLVLSWTRPLDVTLWKQVLTLLCRILTGGPKPPDHECLGAIFECVESLYDDVTGSFDTADDGAAKAQTGQVLDSALTALATIRTPRVQTAASCCIFTIVTRLDTRQVLLDFLPGIFSRLAGILASPKSAQKPPNTLVKSLRVLETLLKTLRSMSGHPATPPQTQPAQLSASSHDTYASNIRVAVKSLSKLQTHDKDEVVEALFQLVFVILESSEGTLTSSADVALDTAVHLCGREDCASSDKWKANMSRLLARERRLIACLAERAREYVSHLPTRLSSASVTSRDRAIAQMKASHFLLLHVAWEDLAGFEESLLTALLTTLGESLPSLYPHRAKVSDAVQFDMHDIHELDSAPFDLLLNQCPPSSLFDQMRVYLASSLGTRITRALEPVLGGSSTFVSHQQRIVAFWLSSRSLEYTTNRQGLQHGVSRLQNLNNVSKSSRLHFEHALDVLLTADTESLDWRLEGLALELVALHAQQIQQQFCLELADVLFPVLKRVASDNSVLRKHAAKCLQVVSTSCGYPGPADAILQNADYLVNATALQLNTLDLGPEGLRVLAVLLQLGGSRLVPYLEDVVDSLFSVLSAFHGYSRLVEHVFDVLSALVNQVAPEKSDAGAFSNRNSDAGGQPSGTETSAGTFGDSLSGDSHRKYFSNIDDPESLDSLAIMDSKDVRQPPPAGKSPTTYTIVKSICQSAKHFLTHQSVKIRYQVLQLLRKACTVLHQIEDEFLPIVHEIWPGLVCRLDDSVHTVVMAALQAVTTIALYAGDFLSSRVEDSWSLLMKISRPALSQQTTSKHEERGRGTCAQLRARQLCVVELLLTLSSSVRFNAKMEDDLFDLLGPLAPYRPIILYSLQKVNTDRARLQLDVPRTSGPTPLKM